MNNFCFSHPWHLHGHSFHVVGQGGDRYDPIQDGNRIQRDILDGKNDFMFRDSVTVYANQTTGDEIDGSFCGWVAIRFSAHNSGIWLVHCHVTPHMIMGKKFVIWEHPKNDPWLKQVMKYGKSKGI
jgi:L-ascorbate oxidase